MIENSIYEKTKKGIINSIDYKKVMKKLIVPTGYMGSGSSAVTDLMSEYENCSNEFKSYEYVFLHCPNGLFDLEDELMYGNNAIKSDYSIRTFYEQMKKLYDKKYWWVGNYKKIIGPQFMKYTQEFVDSITEFHFDGYWYMHQEPNFKMICKLVLRKPIKIIFRNKLFNDKILKYNDGMKLSFIEKKDFYKEANKYIYNIINNISHNVDNVIMDQLLLPFNMYRVDNYFGDDLRAIIVERDPRDVFILNKYVWKEKKISIPYPTDVETFCKYYKKMRKSEHPTNSKKVLRVHFEDLIYKYEETVKTIENFVGFDSDKHINKKRRFNPDLSIKNTQLFNGKTDYENEIKIIEKELKEYLYEFPYNLNNLTADTVEF